MQKLHASIHINAPRAKVWDTMLGDATYREWIKAFGGDSYYKGDWSEGSKIQFLGKDPETGKEMGMTSRIAVNRPHEYISIEHLGIVSEGMEDCTSEQAQLWSNAFENYTFSDKDGGTDLQIEQDMNDEYAAMFQEMWVDALQRIKKLAEA